MFKIHTQDQASKVQMQNQNQENGRKKSRYWANIGVELADGSFVSLPVGVALDDLKVQPIRGKASPEFVQLRQRQQALLSRVQETLSNLKPGEAVINSKLSIEFRRVNDEVEVNSASSDVDFSSLFE